jgi:hypothetical protein
MPLLVPKVRYVWTPGAVRVASTNRRLPYTGSSTGLHRNFCRDLTRSSAVNFPITSTSSRFRCHLDWSRINSLHELRGATTATFHSHNKFNILHLLAPWWTPSEEREQGAFLCSRVHHLWRCQEVARRTTGANKPMMTTTAARSTNYIPRRSHS